MSIVFIPFLLILALAVGSFFARSMTTKRRVTPDRAKYQRRIRLLGTGLLVAGLLIAASIYMQTVLDEQALDATPGAERRDFQRAFAPALEQKADLAMKNIAGKEGVLGVEITEWVQTLAHGKRLAYTVAVLAVAGFLTCLVLAHPHLAEEDAPEEPAAAP